jgi:hypothetical protein
MGADAVIGLMSIAAIVLLIQTGMHVAVSLLAVSVVGLTLIRGDWVIAGNMLAQAATESIANYSFGTIPLFVMMGFFVSVSGIGRDTFDVAGQLFRPFRGGLGMATVSANAVFAAVNGTSIATGLYAAFFGGRGGGVLGARNAHSAQPSHDPVWHRGRNLDWRSLYRRHCAGTAAHAGLLRDDWWLCPLAAPIRVCG